MLAEGKTQREVAEHYGFKNKQVVKKLLERERRKERKLAAGILPRPKGRPRKDAAPGDVVREQAYEIRACLKNVNMPNRRAFCPPGWRNFSLKSVRIPAKKLLASGPKSLAAGHIANFQTSPKRLRMANKLLRDFLRFAGRRWNQWGNASSYFVTERNI